MSLFGIGASLLGGILGSSAANKAADAQLEAANRQVELSRETRDLVFDRLDPFYKAGITGQNALNYMLGLGEAPVIGGTPASIDTIEAKRRGFGGKRAPQYRVGGQVFDNLGEAEAFAAQNATGGREFAPTVQDPSTLTLADFQASPGYQFRLGEGLQATEGAAARQHGLVSGATLNALNKFGSDYASAEYGNFYGRKSNEYNNYLNRLAGVAGSGQNAAAQGGAVAVQTGQQAQNALANIGNAGAAGAIGAGNAWQGALGNAVGSWQYNQLLDKYYGGAA